MTFQYGGELSALLNPLLYGTGALATLFYAKVMGIYIDSYKWLWRLIHLLGGVVLVLALYMVVTVILGDYTQGMTLEDTKQKITNPIMLSLSGNQIVKPSATFNILFLSGFVMQVCVLYAMLKAYSSKKLDDSYIFFGVVISSAALFYEVAAAIFLPSYFFLSVFLANIPEVIRTTILERQRQSAAALQAKAKLISQTEEARSDKMKALTSLVVTFNHHIRNPLAIAKQGLAIYEMQKDKKWLEKVINSHERIEGILEKIDAAVDSYDIEFEDYASNHSMIKLDNEDD